MKYITCPVCGEEYLQDEIFVDLTGKHKVIEKKTDGKIDFYLGDDPEEVTDYICDSCGTRFIVKADTRFTVSQATDKKEHVIKLPSKEDSLF